MKNRDKILPKDENIIHLTLREKECLYWASHGKSAEETAIILNIKLSSVNSYRRLVKAKLHCFSMPQAVYKGAQMGYLKE